MVVYVILSVFFYSRVVFSVFGFGECLYWKFEIYWNVCLFEIRCFVLIVLEISDMYLDILFCFCLLLFVFVDSERKFVVFLKFLVDGLIFDFEDLVLERGKDEVWYKLIMFLDVYGILMYVVFLVCVNGLVFGYLLEDLNVVMFYCLNVIVLLKCRNVEDVYCFSDFLVVFECVVLNGEW